MNKEAAESVRIVDCCPVHQSVAAVQSVVRALRLYRDSRLSAHLSRREM